MRRIKCLMTLIMLIFAVPVFTEQQNEKLTLNLDLVSVFDYRLPTPTKGDLNQIIDEAQRIIAKKFSDKLQVNFIDHGAMTVQEFFSETNYRTNINFQRWYKWEYKTKAGEKNAFLKNPKFRKVALRLLKQWELEALQEYFPGMAVKSYNQALDKLLSEYKNKVNWLKSLTIDGDKKLVLEPSPPFQSDFEWINYMREQDKYDIVIANCLIIYSQPVYPYPHVILKHAKIGGSAFNSPKRNALSGSSIMVDVIEEYGNIVGIAPNIILKSELRNKIIGSILLAHEFGHAYFWLQDYYDHDESCIMNSSGSNFTDFQLLYQKLTNDISPCPKCKPLVDAKLYMIQADLESGKGKFRDAGDHYYDCCMYTIDAMGKRAYSLEVQRYLRGILRLSLGAYRKSNAPDISTRTNEIKSYVSKLDERLRSQ